MKQGSPGFLEHLYSGSLRDDLCFTDFCGIDEAKVRAFVDRYHEIVRQYSPLELEEKGAISDDMLKAFADLGMFGMTIDTEYGGLGFSLSEYLRVVEEMSRTDMAVVLIPLVHLSIGMNGILLFGSDEQKRAYLPKAARGEMIFAYCLTEPAHGSDAQRLTSEARRSEDGAHYVLNGSKSYIINGNYAGAFTVFAQLDPDHPGKKMGAFIVERGWEGVHVGKDMPKMGLTISSTTPIRFEEVKIPKENLIGEEGDGFAIAMGILNHGRLALGAASAGLMSRSLHDMEQRAAGRRQFGVPIRDFELIQEKMVRSAAHAFAARNITYFTANQLERDSHANVAFESSHAKLYGTDRCWDVLYDALQIAGGAGYLRTLPYEKRMRDFRVATIFEGTNEIHSVYPPQALYRRYGAEISRRGSVGRMLYLLRLSRMNPLKSLRAGHPKLDRALRVAARSESMFRGLFRDGFTRYGVRAGEHQFHLRRMTRLSLSLFWLVASVASMRSRHPNGYPDEELALLEYLTEEAVAVQRQVSEEQNSPLERAHRQVYKTSLSNTSANPVE